RRIPVKAGIHTLKASLNDNGGDHFNYVHEETLNLDPGRIMLIDFQDGTGGFIFKNHNATQKEQVSSAYQQAGIKEGEDVTGEGKYGREFALTMPSAASRKLASGWLWLGIASLLGAGLFAILLVLARTPYIQDIFSWVDFFRTALVVPVDLSVLLWFLAFAGVLWSLNASSKFIGFGWLALVLAASGAAMIVLSPFVGVGKPLMSNYVPVLQS